MNLANMFMEHFPESSAYDLHQFMQRWGLGIYVPHYNPITRAVEKAIIRKRFKEARQWILDNSKTPDKK